MKYMGSKRMMLQNGLGELLANEIVSTSRFVDLFAGSGAVAIHVAQQYSVQVLAYDLQTYSTVLTNAVIGRKSQINLQPAWKSWYSGAEKLFDSKKIPKQQKLTQAVVEEFRLWCDEQRNLPITRAYGGHYFSPTQAMWLDALRLSLPSDEPTRIAALAALIRAASQCAASPGHTAQPFQPTRTAKKFLEEAWNLDIVKKAEVAFEAIAKQYAKESGKAEVADANEAAKQLNEADLVFIDPPYSGVHYSRFYHVLETIARGDCGEVTGVGRYPDPELRPRSKYSLQSESSDALDKLLSTVAERQAKAIITFPDHNCSNGLSGDIVRNIARKYFRVKEKVVKSKFSTLGGTAKDDETNEGRGARQQADELMLVLKPK